MAKSIGINFGWKEKATAAVALAALTAKPAFYNSGLRMPVVSD